jgi:hypothetical protein
MCPRQQESGDLAVSLKHLQEEIEEHAYRPTWGTANQQSHIAKGNSFQNTIGKHHPSLCHLTPGIFKEQYNTEHMTMEGGSRAQAKQTQMLEYRRTQRLQRNQSSV